MRAPESLTRDIMERWLDDAGVEFHTCDQCPGLHLPVLQDLEGVIDSRLFLEPWGLLLTTELEIRPMALLPLAADLGRLSMHYPTLKLFQDVVDDATPQLVVAAAQLGAAGLTSAQFSAFVSTTVTTTRQVAEECLQLNYLFAPADPDLTPGSRALH